MSSPPIIEVDHVTKQFQLGQLHSLKQTALDAFSRLRGRAVAERSPFKALDDVDFKIHPGEVVGVIGQNGAGKSTLLKLLAGISKPSHGSVAVRGKVAPLIEVGAGLVPDLTGRENIFLNASILGMKRTDVAKQFDEIVAFAELEEFIDTPIKRYSSGMQVRLGFSIATRVVAEILIVDEVLSVGDLAFQRKCFDRMEDMIRRQGKTVMLVSHNIRQVERICTRVMLFDHGRVVADGDAREVCNLFYEMSEAKVRKQPSASTTPSSRSGHMTSGELELLNATLLDDRGNATDRVKHGSDVTVSLEFAAKTELVNPLFGVGVHTTDFLYLATKDSEGGLRLDRIAPGVFRVECRIRKFPFLAGIYAIRVGVGIGKLTSTAFYAENVIQFQVDPVGGSREQTMREGFVALDAAWSWQESDAKPREDVRVAQG